MKPHTIEGAGVTVDAPSSWKLKEQMKGWYSLKGKSGFVQIRSSDMFVPKSLDDVAKGCGEIIEKDTLDTGAFYVLCKDEAIKGVKTTKVEVTLVIGEKATTCSISTDKDIEKVKKICKSMKKI